jgi:translation initiation factor eIF-2B subunit beta
MPPTPGIHVPAGHYLSDEYRKQHFSGSASPFFMQDGVGGLNSSSSSVGPSSPTTKRPERQADLSHADTTSLSNFVQMRHTRAQLERAGSSLSLQELEYGVKRASDTSRGDATVVASPRQHNLIPFTPTGSSKAYPIQGDDVASAYQQSKEAFHKRSMQIKPVLVDAIREVVDELDTTHEACAKGAREHIHSS